MRGQELQQELQDGSALLQPCSDNPASIRSADVHRLMTSVSIFSWLLSLFLWLCLFYRVNFCDVSLCLSQLLTVNLYIVFQSFCQQNVMFVSAQWACLWDISLSSRPGHVSPWSCWSWPRSWPLHPPSCPAGSGPAPTRGTCPRPGWALWPPGPPGASSPGPSASPAPARTPCPPPPPPWLQEAQSDFQLAFLSGWPGFIRRGV